MPQQFPAPTATYRRVCVAINQTTEEQQEKPQSSAAPTVNMIRRCSINIRIPSNWNIQNMQLLALKANSSYKFRFREAEILKEVNY